MNTESFDAAELFKAQSAHATKWDEIVIRVPEGISLLSLRDSPVGKELLHQQDWYETYTWATKSLAPGTYSVRVPVPNSNRKTFDEQQPLLVEGEEVAPVALVASALLCLQKSGRHGPLTGGGWVRCCATAGGNRVALFWNGGRLSVNADWGGIRRGDVWLASARRTS